MISQEVRTSRINTNTVHKSEFDNLLALIGCIWPHYLYEMKCNANKLDFRKNKFHTAVLNT
jgi:hypothetical protein